jgi:protein SCO1/2
VGQVCNLQRVFNPLGRLKANPHSAGYKPARRMQSCPTKQTLVAFLAVTLAGCMMPGHLPVDALVPDFTLTDQTGATFDSRVLHGRVWIADFMFTNCGGPCPRMSAQMHQVQSALAAENDVRLVSLTVDPARDTPEVLARYAERYQAKPGVWFFLTGARETLQHLDKDVFMLGDVDSTLQHSTRFVLVDRKSHLRGFYLTSEPDSIDRLVKDARDLLKERS